MLRFMIYAVRGEELQFAYTQTPAEALRIGRSLDDDGWDIEISDQSGKGFTVEQFLMLASSLE